MVPSSIASAGHILSSTHCDQFHRNGFLALHEVWNPGAVTEVRDLIDGLFQSAGRECGALPNLVCRMPQLRDTAIFQSCLAIAKQLLGRTTLFACDNALYKEPHGTHGTPWHQDGAFHGRYFPNNTLAFWVPLQDVMPKNGCMQYIPLEKYQILLPHRPYYPNDPQSMMTDHADSSLAIMCPLRTGDAVIHGPLTLHAAFANQSDDIRRTWLLTFRPWGKWGTLAPSRLVQRAKLLRNGLLYQRHV
ncbi:MAG: Phytanoyl-CoA dioxygenase [Nitrospira sp.]|jgi:ectoine hydroxylase-related dioxygenase (phytanoyl-CoA dioxygenase family)|nr:Phytanoyl-CoA dioxygenase [Nitrospira sp.]